MLDCCPCLLLLLFLIIRAWQWEDRKGKDLVLWNPQSTNNPVRLLGKDIWERHCLKIWLRYRWKRNGAFFHISEYTSCIFIWGKSIYYLKQEDWNKLPYWQNSGWSRCFIINLIEWLLLEGQTLGCFLVDDVRESLKVVLSLSTIIDFSRLRVLNPDPKTREIKWISNVLNLLLRKYHLSG